MSSISAGTTVGTALVQTGDTTGNLVIKTGSNATTALTISGADQSITVAGGLNLGAPIAIASGGTGQTTRQNAMDALAGAVTNGLYLRGDGADVVMGTLRAGDMTGTLAVANGGTGQTSLSSNHVLLGNGTSGVQAVAPGSSGNVLTSNGTTWTSTALPAGGVTSLNGQTGAITNTDLGVIGSYVTSYYAITAPASNSNLSVSAGSTTAGSNLRYNTARQIANVSGVFTGGSYAFSIPSNGQPFPAGGTTFSGTWRSLTGCSTTGYTSGCSEFSQWTPGLWVRVS
jgi:hypothetical protein